MKRVDPQLEYVPVDDARRESGRTLQAVVAILMFLDGWAMTGMIGKVSNSSVVDVVAGVVLGRGLGRRSVAILSVDQVADA